MPIRFHLWQDPKLLQFSWSLQYLVLYRTVLLLSQNILGFQRIMHWKREYLKGITDAEETTYWTQLRF